MVYTYHRMIEDCVRGERRGWREFVSHYMPMARRLLLRYGGQPEGDEARRLREIFTATAADDHRFFRSFEGRTERELMVHFRNFVVAHVRSARDAARSTGAPVAALEVLEQALAELTVLQRQAVWLFTMGYAPADVAPIVNVKPETAAEIIASAQEKLRGKMDAWSEGSLRDSLDALREELPARETADCYSYLVFHRIVDGQITWRDREVALAHLARCFRCVDRFCVLQEVVCFSRALPPAPGAEVEAVLRELGFPERKTKGVFARLFG